MRQTSECVGWQFQARRLSYAKDTRIITLGTSMGPSLRVTSLVDHRQRHDGRDRRGKHAAEWNLAMVPKLTYPDSQGMHLT